jgi:hypothetical protein
VVLPLLVIGASVVLLILIAASPIALFFVATNEKLSTYWPVDWQLMADVGQAYGGISAILSGLAFIAVAATVFMQFRQTRISQLQAVNATQIELFRTAYDHPDLQTAWRGSPVSKLSSTMWRRHTYLNLVFRYFQLGYELRVISDGAIRQGAAERFGTQFSRDYWANGRIMWANSANSVRQRRFIKIIDEAYQSAASDPPTSEPQEDPEPAVIEVASPMDKKDSAEPIAIAAVASILAGIAIGLIVRRHR